MFTKEANLVAAGIIYGSDVDIYSSTSKIRINVRDYPNLLAVSHEGFLDVETTCYSKDDRNHSTTKIYGNSNRLLATLKQCGFELRATTVVDSQLKVSLLKDVLPPGDIYCPFAHASRFSTVNSKKKWLPSNNSSQPRRGLPIVGRADLLRASNDLHKLMATIGTKLMPLTEDISCSMMEKTKGLSTVQSCLLTLT